MLLTRIALANVRNYAELLFEPAPGLNVLVGANAQGKSNLLEAIALLGTGKSFRTARDGEIVRTGTRDAQVLGNARLRAGELRLSCELAVAGGRTRKRYTVNGEPVRYAGFLGRARVVTFVPEDLALVGGPPALRRALLNAALAQERPAYYAALARYARYLLQRNALLRTEAAPPDELLDAYDEGLAGAGAELMLARGAFVRELAAEAIAVHASWVGDDPAASFDVRYAPNAPLDPAAERADLAASLVARFAAHRAVDRLRRLTLVGPHRDDLILSLGGRALATYGSQGQRRTAVLALKVAEYRVMHARSGEAPLLLLDDVLSELDDVRRRAFLGGVAGVQQAFLTTTHEIPDLVAGAAYRVHDATLRRVA